MRSGSSRHPLSRAAKEEERRLMAGDGSGLPDTLLGPDGFRVLGVGELEDDVVVLVETAERVGCALFGVIAGAPNRMQIDIWDRRRRVLLHTGVV